MSLLYTFDGESEEILKPCHLAKPVEDFPEVVVATFSEKIMALVRNMDGSREISSFNAGFRLPVYQIGYRGKKLAVYQTLIGGPVSVGLLEEAIAKGGRKFVFFGSCGTLDRNIPAGHLIVPTAAYRDEGVSYHYAPAADYLPVATAGELAGILTQLGVPFIQGKTWTTDAIYRETRNNMAQRKAEGCITVEMECASLMAAGGFRNIPVYQFLYSEDNLDAELWDARTLGRQPKNAAEQYLRIALEIASRI